MQILTGTLKAENSQELGAKKPHRSMGGVVPPQSSKGVCPLKRAPDPRTDGRAPKLATCADLAGLGLIAKKLMAGCRVCSVLICCRPRFPPSRREVLCGSSPAGVVSNLGSDGYEHRIAGAAFVASISAAFVHHTFKERHLTDEVISGLRLTKGMPGEEAFGVAGLAAAIIIFLVLSLVLAKSVCH